MSAARAITDAELMQLPGDGNKRQLVDGAIEVSPAGFRHGWIGTLLGARLVAVVEKRRLGRVADSSTGYRMKSGNVRSPDLSFVVARRLPRGGADDAFFEGAPDLAVEILSAGNKTAKGKRQLDSAIAEYLANGVRLVWVIDPVERRAVAYKGSLTEIESMGPHGILDGGDVIPGFRCKLSSVLGDVRR
jgi:Uma2 family endonuclease